MVTSNLAGFRLSPQQEDLWRAHGTWPVRGFVSQGVLELRGPLDRDRLRHAVERVVERHEILRTAFRRLPGMSLPIQVIEDRGAVLWNEAETSGEAEVERLLAEGRRSPLRPDAAAVLQASLVPLGEDRHALLLTLPALAADALSLRLLAYEIAALVRGEELPEPLQYADAAETLQEWLGPEDGPGADFWRQQGAPSFLPADAAEPAAPETVHRLLPADLAADLARRLEAPLSLVLLAAWSAALWWETGEERRAIAVSHNGRTIDELAEAVGLYARYLPLPGLAGPGIMFGELTRSLEEALTTAAAWQDAFSLDRLAAGSGDGGAVPYWPFGFDSDRAAVLSPALTFRPGFVGLGRFGLRLSVLEDTTTAAVALHYDPARYDRGRAERLLDRLERVLAGADADAEAPLAEIDVLGEAERGEILAVFNDTAAPSPAGATVCDLFEEQARLAPQAPAVTAAGHGTLTFGELDARANRLARHLSALGIGPESRVGIHLEREPEMVVALLAVLKVGGAYVPFDVGHPAERLRFLLEDAGLAALITRELLRPAGADAVRTVLVDTDSTAASRQDATPPPRHIGPDNAAYVIYTSGSTGLPKGVVVTHRGLLSYLSWARTAYAAGPGRGAPVHSPLGFDLTVTSLFVPLLAGASVTMLPEEDGISALAEALRATAGDGHGFGLAKITPAHLGLLRQLTAEGEPPPSAGCLVIGGDALWTADIAPWLRQGTRIFNEYGPTETVVGCCVHEVDPASTEDGAVPIGRPIANTRLYVMGPGLRPVPAEVPGELWIGGDGVARGYLGRPGLTAERFVPDPFAAPDRAGARLYRTGDLVRLRLPGPGLEFLGRIDDQVKIRGHRIEPGEVATALAAHPGLRDTAVAVRGAGDDRRLVAWVVARDRARRPSAAELRGFLAGRLPAPMIPSAFVHLDVLPLTPNGKLDRRALPDPDPHRDEETPYAPPRTLTEEVLVEIWGKVLEVDRVGIDDPFFSRGGDSIRSLQILTLAQKRGLQVTLQDLFERPTIRSLAASVRLDGAEQIPAPPPFSLVSEEERRRLDLGLEDAYPLTHLQAGMLYHSELAPDSAIYHDLHSFRLRGRYDAELLATAIEQVTHRHPLLRTSFDLTRFSEPLQLVHRRVEIPLAIDDLRHLSVGEGRRIVLAWLDQETLQPFDWTHVPLARFQIHLYCDGTFQFTLSFHHAILDGWSSASLLTELFRRYLALLDLGDGAAVEPPPSATLREFVHLERSALGSAEAREFWRRHLEDSPLVRLPRSRPKTSGGRAEYFEVPLPPGLSDGLKQVARSLSLPLKSVLMGVHFRVFGLLCGLTDVVSGVVSNGRPERSDGEQAIGLFLNTLPLRMTLPGGSWSDLAHGAFQIERASLPFRRFPLAEMQRMEGRTLFEVAFNFLHFHVYDRLAGLTGMEVVSREGYEETNFSLITYFQLSGASLDVHCGFAYQAAEHDRAEIEAVGRRYVAALEALATAPQAPYDAWALFTEAERAQLAAWNDTARPPRLPLLVHQIFEVQATRTPEAVAAEMGDERLSYRELDLRAARLARHLRSAGVGPDDPVGMCLERSLAVPVAILGILKAGGAYLPLDPAYPAERLAAMADDARLRWLVCDEATLGRLPAGLAERQVLLLGAAGELAGGAAAEDGELPVPVAPDNLAYVLYTSGSTGRPKGVVMPHAPLSNLIDWQIEATTAPGPVRTAQFSSLSFDASFHEMFTTWGQGGTLVLVSEAVRRDAGSLLHLLDERSVEQLFLPFVALQQLADEAAMSGALPTALREVITAGEQLQATAAVRGLFERLPGCRLVNAYGPTETHVVTAFTLPESPAAWPTLPPIGPVIANLWARVLDASLQPVLPGAPGEVYFGGAGLARGYLGRADATAERFLPDPQAAEPGARIYRTGDLARHLPDGCIEFLGRNDHQVKVRGFRVEPGEIEAALSLHPEVREAAVVVREVSGPGDRRLVGYFVPRRGSAAEAGDALAGELRAFLSGRLPEYMVPWALVPLDAFPLTPSGKLDRRNLPAPEAVRRLGAEPAPLRGPVEEVLAGIWAEVLGVERVGADDNFFELGGHSLLATRVMSRLRSAFDIAMPLRALFEASTLADLAAQVETALRAGARQTAPPLVPVSRQGVLPPSFAQQRLWFIDQLDPGSSLYNMPVALRAQGPLDARVLELCLSEIVRRHEALRTVFAAREGSPVLVIRPPAPFGLAVVDLSGLPESRREAMASFLAAEEAARPFDLARGPLLRGVLLRLAPQDHVVSLTLHHIVSDGWSMGVLVREVTALYTALAAGRPSPLPELPLQYADFAVWQRGWLDQEALQELAGYWRERLAGAPPQLDLPGGRPRPAALSLRGAAIRRSFSAPLLEQLRALGRRESATLFMTLLAPLQALLHSRTGAADLVVGTDVAGRDRRETEGLIGFFINQLPLRADLTGNPTLRELLARVRETALEAYVHQDLPFDHLVEALRVEQSLQRSPVFQVKLVLLNATQESLELPDLTLKIVPLSTETAQLDLHWRVMERDEDLWVTLTYSTDLYDEPLIAGLLDEYELWLQAFVERPDAQLGDVVAELAEAERARRVQHGRELKSKGLGKLRDSRRQAEELIEAGS
jgi:amino acid adenylation domain-containing protein